MTEKDLFWYVAVTYRKEKIIKQELDKMQIEHFIPFREVTKERFGKKITVSELVIPGYVFIHTDPKTSIALTRNLDFCMRYLKEPKTYVPVIVPEKQMRDFIFLLTFPGYHTKIITPNLKRGDRVRVIQGPFQGIEGELIRISGHKRVVIRMSDVLAVATTYIPAAFLEKVEVSEK